MDAWIIDRIRRERQEREQIDKRAPLYAPTPPPPRPQDRRDPEDAPNRGSEVIDYRL